MGAPAYKESQATYRDYLEWDTEDRFELHNGDPVMMTPSPGREHQDITGSIYSEIRSALKEKGSPCRAFIAPFDVVLPEPGQNANDSTSVVQPDVLVVCDPEKITNKNCTGAPDLVVEVTIPSTAIIDQKFKYELYERHDVQEYWIVHPSDRYLLRYRMGPDGNFERAGVHGKDERVVLFFMDGAELDLGDVFYE